MKRLKIIPKVWEYAEELEKPEFEDTYQFIEFLEEVRPYNGTYKEGIHIAFIDGVRRTELACYIEEEEKYKGEGIFVSVGVGRLVVKLGRVNLLSQSIFGTRVERFLVVRGETDLPEIINIDTLRFNVRYVNEEPTLKVNRIMREELESSVAREACEDVDIDLVICDGPLSYTLKNSSCIGFIKNIKKLYIRPEDLQILKELKRGQRTPIIRINRGNVEKYTWYVKLSHEDDINSLARLEMFAYNDFEKVVHIANLTAGVLPIFASRPYMDKRAPQNLAPIRSLESTLRSYLGNYSIIRNKILSYITEYF